MAQEQIELEFRDELQKLAQMQQMLQNPQFVQQNPQAQNETMALQQKIEARKATLVAEMMEEFMQEEKKITSQFDHDPIAKLRSRELDIRAIDNEKKRQEAEQRLNLENMKALMNQNIQEEKMDQNEDLAELRAETSIEKQEMANANRLKLAGMKPKTNGRGK
jgi:hypothetical protein